MKGETSWLIYTFLFYKGGFPGGSVVKNPPVNAGRRHRRSGFNPWVRNISWRRKWHSNILAWRIPWIEESGGLQLMGLKELDMTEHACTCTSYPVNLCIKYVTLCIIFILFFIIYSLPVQNFNCMTWKKFLNICKKIIS